MFPPEFEAGVGRIIQGYLLDTTEGIRKVCTEQILSPVIDMIVSTIKCGGTIFAFGNGGSHAEADVFLYALEKIIDPEFRFITIGAPKSAEILDTDSEHLFDRTLKRKGKEGDAAILISASGDSVNILNASKLCRSLIIETASISANGMIVNDLSTMPDHPIVIQLGDQQKLEEVTLGTLLILARQVERKLLGQTETIEETREKYLALLNARALITPDLLVRMVEDIIAAFRARSVVRVDSTSGILKPVAEHMAHNLIWDARDETQEVWSNLVLSGLLDCHMTGVGNDGGCGYNGAIELADNGRTGDVEILLATTLDSIKSKSMIKASRERGVSTHTICFGAQDDLVAAGLAQITAHLTGRMTNTGLLLEQGRIEPDKALRWMRNHDLALLRKKEATRSRLVATLG